MSSNNNLKTILVVWDFDNTMIDENCDTYIVKELGDESLLAEMRRMYRGGLEWLSIMNEMFVRLLLDEAKARQVFASIPLASNVETALEKALANENIENIIVSDANSLFVEYILEAKGIDMSRFDAIYTNRAKLQDVGDGGRGKRIVVTGFFDGVSAKHDCQQILQPCPQRLCKGTILRTHCAYGPTPKLQRFNTPHTSTHIVSTNDPFDLDATTTTTATVTTATAAATCCEEKEKEHNHNNSKYAKIIVVGDGRGDFCMSMEATENDAILAREDYPLVKLLKEHAAHVRAPVHHWNVSNFDALLDQCLHVSSAL